MNVGEVATPLESVVAEAVVKLPANVPLAPLAGAVKVTVAPDMPLPAESCTVALKVVANEELISAP